MKQNGVGTELKRIVKDWFGVTASPACGCNDLADGLDGSGIEWCEKNIEVVVGWLAEGVKKWAAEKPESIWGKVAKVCLCRTPAIVQRIALRPLVWEAIRAARLKARAATRKSVPLTTKPANRLVDCDHRPEQVCIHSSVPNWTPEMCFGCTLRTTASKRKPRQ